ncbi:class I SAM-dependent methyltransferase [Luteimonas sp BLCC-B24]|uniref:class I SAM-dependent methyltransferase n=1 Tax=Luteimonas sp. BLCC-B24 TaxID=3025317 RepID=UPI00234CF4D3|nr:class I SAM-dependent methyltransferase [Luteimonas sp. BLCC-B24]MDC7808434.1 class I SAM-dependent methyltransferase [Luteimonas sp. BLCC-B24]
MSDPALDALFLPLEQRQLAWPDDGALFLRARAGVPTTGGRWPGLVCEQSFKPLHAALQRAGLDALDGEPDDAVLPRRSLVLVLPPRQRDESRAVLARALQAVRPGGWVLASVANDEGAKSAQDDLATLAGNIGALSKHKCRVFWAQAGETVDTALVERWAALDRPRDVLGGRFRSRPGVFAWDRIDPASALLASHLPTTLAGRVADLGAGYGYLSAELLQRCPGITALDVFEAEGRALALARHNLAAIDTRAALNFHWHDVTTGVPPGYDVVVSNPPFHAHGREGRPDIGRAFIAAAAAALRPGGALWLVANRHLPYEDVLDARFGEVSEVASSGAFKVIHAVRARASAAKARA